MSFTGASVDSGEAAAPSVWRVDALVQLVHRVASLRRVCATLPYLQSGGINRQNATTDVSTEYLLEVLLSSTSLDRRAVEDVAAFVASPRALQGSMRLPATVAPHPLVDLDIDAHMQACARALHAASLEDLSADDCVCTDVLPPGTRRHTPILCRTLRDVVAYQSNVMVPFRAFLAHTLQPTLTHVAASWRREGHGAPPPPSYSGATDVASALRCVADGLQQWWAQRVQCVVTACRALDDAAASLAAMLTDLADAVSASSSSPTHAASLSDAFCANVLRICGDAEDEVGRWMDAVHAATTNERLPSDDRIPPQVVAALLRASQPTATSVGLSVEGMRAAMANLALLLLERSTVEADFTSASYAMVEDSIGGMARQHATLLDGYQDLCHLQNAEREAIINHNAVQWDTLTAAFRILTPLPLQRSNNVKAPPPLQGSPPPPRPAWWEDASDEDAEPTSSAVAVVQASQAAPSRPTSSLCSELSAALTALCRQRLGALPAATDDVSALRQQGILEALFDAWKAKAVRTAVFYIAHAHTRPDASAVNVDMKELLCALLDVWSLSVQRIGVDAAEDNTTRRAGEQAMRDVALVVHLLLHRCSAALVAAPVDDDTAPGTVVTCVVPSDDDASDNVSDAFWLDVYDVLWFQVDPLGSASGGYLFPLSPRGDGISPLAQHSFGFLTLRRVVLVVSAPLQLQFVYHTTMFATDRQRRAETCIRGRTLEQHMRNERRHRTAASGGGAHAAIATRVALMRRVIYCFAKLEKHKLLLQPSNHHHSGFACDVDAVSITPLTETIVVWHYADADTSTDERVGVDNHATSGSQGGVACVGIVPPQALALKRRSAGALPLPLSVHTDDLQQSVVAQLAFVVQRLSLFAQPTIPLLADAAEALLESIIVGAPPATQRQGCLSVAAFLCFFDDLAASMDTKATPAPAVSTPVASTPRPCRGEGVVGARSFSVQTVADDDSAAIGDGHQEGNRIDSFNFSRQTPTPRAHHPRGDDTPQEGVGLLSLRASKKRWNSDVTSPGEFAIPELSSKTCADDKHIVVRPAHPSSSSSSAMEMAFAAQLEDADMGGMFAHDTSVGGRGADNDVDPLLPTAVGALVPLPAHVGALFQVVAENASSKVQSYRKSSPHIRSPAQRRGISPMRSGPSIDAFVFSAPLEIAVHAASRQVVSPRLRELVTSTAKRLKLRALELASPHDLYQTTLETDDDATSFLGVPVPRRPQAARPSSGKENNGRDVVPAAMKRQQWLMLTRSDGTKEWGFLALRLR